MIEKYPWGYEFDYKEVIELVAETGSVSRASLKLGLRPSNLRNIALGRMKRGDYHLRFALEAGLFIYRSNKVKRLSKAV